MDMRAWSPAYAGSEILEPPGFDSERERAPRRGEAAPARRVIVSMRDHALRRIVASVLRGDEIDAIEAFDDPQTLDELKRSTAERRVEAVLVDARRDPFAAITTIAKARAADPSLALIALMVRRDDDFVRAATSRGAVVLRLPMTSRDLRATLDAAAGTSFITPVPEAAAALAST